MLETYILKIDKHLEKDDFNRILGYVSTERREQICQFYRYEDRQRSLLGDVLARYAICKRTGARNTDLIFKKNEYGKPILFEPNRIYFNISHSGNWVVCSIDDRSVGIDVEIVKTIDLTIAERFFSRDEYRMLINQPETIKLKFFYMIWTLKESYIKAEGKGLSIPLNSFSIKISDHNIYSISNGKIGKWNFFQSFLDDNTVCAICTLSSNFNKSINLNIKRFLNEVM